MRAEAIAGCLVGMAVGDALGLPRESLSARRGQRLFPDLDRYHFLFGRGMFSDDTEHACMTARALLVSGGEPDRFVRSLAWRLRGWLLGLPLGTGKATLKACLKLWLGWGPRRSGVRSAGNGPCTRAPILGVCWGHEPARLAELVRRATRITHTDPRAEQAALLVAGAAYHAAESADRRFDPTAARARLTAILPGDAGAWSDLLARVFERQDESTEAFAHSLGLTRGVSGFVLHTVPVVLHAWLRHPNDYRSAVQSVIRCGGDTDTLAAIVGGLVGARVGPVGIPEAWRAGLAEWPRDIRWMEKLASRLASASGQPAPGLKASLPAILTRNLLFDLVVMAHVLRRLVPPY